MGADWGQLQQLEEELQQRLLAALERAAQLGLDEEDVKLLAFGCGLTAPTVKHRSDEDERVYG